MASTVVQYGFRDVDDDSDDGKGRRRSSSSRFLSRQSSHSSLKKLGRVINDTKSLLAGANIHTHMNHLYGLDGSNASEEDSSESSYESESDSDHHSDGGASVCSKASVASKASQTFKKLGGKLRGSIRVVSKRRSSSGKKRDVPPPPPDHDEDDVSVLGSDDEDEDDGEDEGSVASRASDAVKRVTGKLGKALRVVGRRRSSGKSRPKETEDTYESDDDDSLSSCEEDLFLAPTAAVPPRRRGPDDRAPSRSKSYTERGQPPNSSSSHRDNRQPLRRSHTSKFDDPTEESLKHYEWNMNVPPTLLVATNRSA